MAGNFFGGQFFGGGFFGTVGAGGYLPLGQRRRRFVLPDGAVVHETKAGMRTILTQLAEELGDEERAIVPVIKRERKKERKSYSLPDEVELKPQILMTKIYETPQIEVDTAAMIRAYVIGSLKRKEEEEWLMLMVN